MRRQIRAAIMTIKKNHDKLRSKLTLPSTVTLASFLRHLLGCYVVYFSCMLLADGGTLLFTSSEVQAASILPTAAYTAGFTTGQPHIYSTGHYLGTYDGAAYNFVISPQYLLNAGSVSSGGPMDAHASSFIDTAYYFEIAGPAAQNVPLSITYSMSVSAADTYAPQGTPSAYAESEIIYPVAISPSHPQGYSDYRLSVDAFNGASYSKSIIRSPTSYLNANTQYLMRISTASAIDNTDYFGNCCYAGRYRASVDPYLQIAASYPNANRYSIVFSSGVHNGTVPVPEPGSLFVFAVGWFGIAIAMRSTYNFSNDSDELQKDTDDTVDST